jgi:hypothetical protein
LQCYRIKDRFSGGGEATEIATMNGLPLHQRLMRFQVEAIAVGQNV